MKNNVLTGMLLMALAMLLIPVVDGIGKLLSAHYSPLFVSWARYVAASLIVIPLAMARFGMRFLPSENHGSHFLRTLFLMIAMSLYFVAVSQIPMATAISAYFVGPIIGSMLAVWLLGERLTIKKILALILGFGGALIIVRPGSAVEPGILLALGAGFFFGLYMVATRKASLTSDPIKTLAFQCLVGALILTPQAIVTWQVPSVDLWTLFAGLGLFSVVSHLLSITAFRFAEASVLSPLVYLELIGSAVFGFVVFGELPGVMIWLGAAIIVSGGLLLLSESGPTDK